jgi:hypothetical protein
MSTRQRFKQARMLPTPIGYPPLEFVPWAFGLMKPIPSISLSVTVGNTPTIYLKIFIPANTWAVGKYLFVHAVIQQNLFLPNHPGGPTWVESYEVPTVGTWTRSTSLVGLTAPSQSTYQIDRVFLRRSPQELAEINYQAANKFTPAQPPYINEFLEMTPVIGAYDFSINNYLNFRIQTNFVGSVDECNTQQAQALIQSPLDLRRLQS